MCVNRPTIEDLIRREAAHQGQSFGVDYNIQ